MVSYLRCRCIFDACACDQGGDCECLCTAIAAYAQQCAISGVPIKWRSEQLCGKCIYLTFAIGNDLYLHLNRWNESVLDFLFYVAVL